jgi:hypothetical protein
MDREQFRKLPESFVGAKVRIREYLVKLGKEGKIAWTGLNGGPFFEMCKFKQCTVMYFPQEEYCLV